MRTVSHGLVAHNEVSWGYRMGHRTGPDHVLSLGFIPRLQKAPHSTRIKNMKSSSLRRWVLTERLGEMGRGSGVVWVEG